MATAWCRPVLAPPLGTAGTAAQGLPLSPPKRGLPQRKKGASRRLFYSQIYSSQLFGLSRPLYQHHADLRVIWVQPLDPPLQPGEQRDRQAGAAAEKYPIGRDASLIY